MTDTSFLNALLSTEQVSTTDADRDHHGRDWGTAERDASPPDVVVWPETTAEVADVLAAATERGVPVTPFAAGTGIEGNAVPTHGGISLDLTRMDSVDEVRPADRQIDVEAGVVGAAVDDAVASHGLFFPPLPTSAEMATVGGMIATNASGKRTVKYGKVADWVREIEVVLADGSVFTAGTRAEKSSSGYNLRDLIVGSEGTLGVVTRATLQLAGRPEQSRVGRASFASIEDATAAAADIVRSGVDVSAVELVDTLSARMVNDYIGSTLPEGPMLFLELQADHAVDAEVDFCRGVIDAHDPVSVEFEDRSTGADVWEPRRELADAVRAYYPDRRSLHAGDVAVPVSSYAALLGRIHELSDEYDIPIPTFGHAGDGNVHFDVLVDPTDESSVADAADIYEEVVGMAIDLGGTATGEHGIGRGKRRFLLVEHGETGVRAMRAIKDALDPAGTLNPGKIFPDEPDESSE
ncbi:FAD-binding oxidoreductase [Halorarum halophilum]|uniref:D-lactate dehydrogenase (cytochrome) n=1 Tax=Halorarum halophilum TaxID=2743090 RepID=A0A7D5GIF6_9EURY|nr:FAD-binding oxidoreductase [Halobaculum halophilum]QLG26104.1 FAD-binding oxidoreductase [Halobaculum halophilum]